MIYQLKQGDFPGPTPRQLPSRVAYDYLPVSPIISHYIPMVK